MQRQYAKSIRVFPGDLDRPFASIHEAEARELVRKGLAREELSFGKGDRVLAVRLTPLAAEGEAHYSRTRISVGGLRAAAGRSQVYTTITRSSSGTLLHSFKHIDPIDRPAFGTTIGAAMRRSA